MNKCATIDTRLFYYDVLEKNKLQSAINKLIRMRYLPIYEQMCNHLYRTVLLWRPGKSGACSANFGYCQQNSQQATTLDWEPMIEYHPKLINFLRTFYLECCICINWSLRCLSAGLIKKKYILFTFFTFLKSNYYRNPPNPAHFPQWLSSKSWIFQSCSV